MCIDLKSFYASVECVLRHLDPLTTNLVVADPSRTEKTICLAVTPSLKSYGISGRARLFEVIEKVKEINNERLKNTKNHIFTGSSYDNELLKKEINLKLDYITAVPRMNYYMKYSAKIYNIYLKYISRDDIFSYSIDEVFCDITEYLKYYNKTPKELATMIIHDVYNTTGITATCGIGTNMYLAKIAMDIVAKHMDPDKNGVRIAQIDEMSYRKLLWNHTPITDFWRVGPGSARRLSNNKMYTMGDIARCSIENEKLLYKLFGVNAELLIDHAWGYEPCTIKSAKSYKPQSKSISSGQVLHTPYTYEKARLIVKEMTELLVLDLVSKKYMTNLISLSIGYDVSNLTDSNIKKHYHGEIVVDHYGRYVPKGAHSSIKLEKRTSSTKIIMEKMLELFDEIANPKLLVRRINICFSSLLNEKESSKEVVYKQFDLFSNTSEIDINKINEEKNIKEEKKLQETMISIMNKYGRNSILKAMNLEEGATTIDRNTEVGGHKG